MTKQSLIFLTLGSLILASAQASSLETSRLLGEQANVRALKESLFAEPLTDVELRKMLEDVYSNLDAGKPEGIAKHFTNDLEFHWTNFSHQLKISQTVKGSTNALDFWLAHHELSSGYKAVAPKTSFNVTEFNYPAAWITGTVTHTGVAVSQFQQVFLFENNKVRETLWMWPQMSKPDGNLMEKGILPRALDAVFKNQKANLEQVLRATFSAEPKILFVSNNFASAIPKIMKATTIGEFAKLLIRLHGKKHGTTLTQYRVEQSAPGYAAVTGTIQYNTKSPLLGTFTAVFEFGHIQGIQKVTSATISFNWSSETHRMLDGLDVFY